MGKRAAEPSGSEAAALKRGERPVKIDQHAGGVLEEFEDEYEDEYETEDEVVEVGADGNVENEEGEEHQGKGAARKKGSECPLAGGAEHNTILSRLYF
jgi:ribosome assembly protein RRB1